MSNKIELPLLTARSLGRALDLAVDDYSERWDPALQRQFAMDQVYAGIRHIRKFYKNMGFPAQFEQDLDYKIKGLSEMFADGAVKYGIQFAWREPADFKIAGQRPQGISAIASFVSKCAIRCLMESDQPSPVKLSPHAKEVIEELRAGPSHHYFSSLVEIDDANHVAKWYYELTQPGMAAYAKRGVEMLIEKLRPGSPFTFFLCTRAHAELLLGKVSSASESSMIGEECSLNDNTIAPAGADDGIATDDDPWEELRNATEKLVKCTTVTISQEFPVVDHEKKAVILDQIEEAKIKKEELIKEVADAIVTQAKKFFIKVE